MYALKSIETDKFEVREDAESLIVPAVITREGVYEYGDMFTYEPAEILEEAAYAARHAVPPLCEEHPPTIILDSIDLIRGSARNCTFEKDRIKADLVFDKKLCSPKYLNNIKAGKTKSVSIGFFYDVETQKGKFNKQHYDYAITKMFIDHVAVGSWQGRCAYPFCGIGLDGKLLGSNPYPNEHSCRLQDPETLDIVGSGERKHNGKTYRVIFGKPKGEKDAGSVEQAYRYPVETWTEAEARKHCEVHDGTFEPAAKEKEGDVLKGKKQEERREGEPKADRERFMEHYNLTDEQMDQILEWIGEDVYKLLPERGEGLAQAEEEGEREKLHKEAEAREKKYGIKFREDKGHLTPPADYPQDEEDYADPVNYAYPLAPKDRCQNALGRWGAFREEYTQPERNIIYERIVRKALKYDMTVRYNSELPEARALPENLKKQLEGYESADSLTAKVNVLVEQLKIVA
jgi:hypothetical protein